MKQILALMAITLLIAAPVMAQEIDYCEGDFDCDGDCDGTDASVFKSDFGRSSFSNPCPDCYIDIPKTGQTTSYATGDDGDVEMGFEPEPNPRFKDNGNGTVMDNLTRLVWMKDINCFGTRTWNNALSDCNGLEHGECGLTDGSSAGDWRLPNRFELESLLDLENYNPALPSGHSFINVQSDVYWSSTTHANFTDLAWCVGMAFGVVYSGTKEGPHGDSSYVWPVRGGQ